MFSRFIWPLVLVVLGIALEVAAIFSFFTGLKPSGTDVPAPGQTKVLLQTAGDYTLWVQTNGLPTNPFHSSSLPTNTNIHIMKLPAGEEIAWKPTGSIHWSWMGIERDGVANLTIPAPGEYAVSITGFEETRSFYLDKSNLGGTLLKTLGFGFLGALPFFGGLIWAIVLLVRKPKKSAATPPASPPQMPTSKF